MSFRAHVLVAIVTLFSLLFILRMVRRRALRAKYSLLWLGVGAALVLITVAPGLLDRLAERLGIDYPPAVYLLVAVTFLLVVVMHFSWELSRLEERMRTMAEELALLRAGEPVDPPVDQ